MNTELKYHRHAFGLGVGLCLLVSSAAWALPPTSLPGPADAGRINSTDHELPAPTTPDIGIDLPKSVPSLPIPAGAKSIHFKLDHVVLVGVTAFDPTEFADIYAPYIGHDVTLDVAYTIASQITERYRNAGYFLSLAYIPNQRIRDGSVTIRVVEGFVGKIELAGPQADSWIMQDYITRLTAMKPVTSDAVESFLLRINDIPGYSYRAVLSSLDGATEGAVKLTLTPQTKEGRGMVTFDNYSSRFLGPHEASASYTTSFLPDQQTTFSVLTSLPTEKLNYGTVSHNILIAPDLTLQFDVGHTRAHPGFTLEDSNVNSNSTTLGTSLNYQWIRQRQENLALKLTMDGRNTASELLGSRLSRDHIRTVRAGLSYDAADRWSGYNNAAITVTQGIDGLGASKKGEADLSRAEALPSFSKLEASFTRLQAITDDWALQFAASGQLASGPLYSSEEFGYGGQAFGRAFDESEIVGDHGVAASMEVRYGGWKDLAPSVTLQPYAFVDTGQVWNEDVGQPAHQTGTSTGFGVRFATEWNQSGGVGVALPIVREVASPIYGSGVDGPRVLLRVSQDF